MAKCANLTTAKCMSKAMLYITAHRYSKGFGPIRPRREPPFFVSMITWRGADMDDLRWRKLTATHEMEIVLLKSLIEGAT